MYIRTTDHLMDDMCMSLGGRAVEEIVFGKISTGALSDLQHVTRMAYAMVSMYGMNAAVGNISFYDPQNENSFSKPYSEETGKLIDEEVRKLVDQAYTKVKALLTEKIDGVRVIAEELLKREVLFKDDMERLLGKRQYEDNSPTGDEEDEETPKADAVVAEVKDDEKEQAG
jgi:cell division protease FtsH